MREGTTEAGAPDLEISVTVPGGRVWTGTWGVGGRGVPLLCLHGGPGFPHDYLEPLTALADERPVVLYDQLGCGRSDRPADEGLWTLDRFLEELAAVRAALGLERCHLWGNSWGGWLALQSVLDQRPAPLSLGICGSPPSVAQWLEGCAVLRAALPAEVRTTLDRHEAAGWFDCPEYLAAVTVFYRRHLCRLPVWPDCVERTFAGAGAGVYRAMWGPSEFGPVTGRLAGWDVVGRLGEIAVPTLVTGGRFDEARPEHLAALAGALADGRFEIFADSAHLPFVEKTSRYLAVLRSFLREHG